MIVDVRKRTTKYHTTRHHNSYGIQKWLVSKGFILDDIKKTKVNKEEYQALIKEFCLQVRGFDESRVKGFHTYEAFIQNIWPNFCAYCVQKYSPIADQDADIQIDMMEEEVDDWNNDYH